MMPESQDDLLVRITIVASDSRLHERHGVVTETLTTVSSSKSSVELRASTLQISAAILIGHKADIFYRVANKWGVAKNGSFICHTLRESTNPYKHSNMITPKLHQSQEYEYPFPRITSGDT